MKRIFLSIVFVMVAYPLIAGGNITLEIADNYFSRLAYTKAAEYYQKYIDKNAEDIYAWERLAKCYEMTNDYDNHASTLKQLVALEAVDDISYLDYGQVLQIKGDYDESAKWLQKYAEKHPDDRRAANQLKSSIELAARGADPVNRYDIANMDFNTEHMEFGPNIFNRTLLYTSSASEQTTGVRVHQWTGDSYTDIKQYERDSSEVFIFFNEMDEINTTYNDGIFTVDPVNSDFYYTRNNFNPEKAFNKKGTNSERHMNLKIYVAENHLGKIGKVREFEFNSPEYNTAHPTISPGGDFLVFVSDQPDSTAGGRDLYFCSRDSSGWSAPQLLTTSVNTEGDEIFPYFHADGSLFFSSDGLGSIGGLDIFRAEIDFESNELVSLHRLESNINSSYDDFGIVFDDKRNGYFTSDRTGGKGKDDIYAFHDKQIMLEGLVVDAETQEILPGAEASVSLGGTEIFSGITDKSGMFTTYVYEDQRYDLFGDQDYYHPVNLELNTESTEGKDVIKVKLAVEPVRYYVQVLEAGTERPMSSVSVNLLFGCDQPEADVLTNAMGKRQIPVYKSCQYDLKAKTSGYLASNKSWTSPSEDKDQTIVIYLEKIHFEPIALNNIYYDFDKATIRLNESSEDLEMVLGFLKDNPELTIQINSHTDARGSKAYNVDLSQRRAQSVVNWLLSRKTDEARLNAIGYGETSPVNKCVDGVKCSEEEHQLNRRTEFQVVNKDGSTKIASDARKDIRVDPCKNCPF